MWFSPASPYNGNGHSFGRFPLKAIVFCDRACFTCALIAPASYTQRRAVQGGTEPRSRACAVANRGDSELRSDPRNAGYC